MNKERLGAVAEWLEDGAKHERISFDMRKGLLIKAKYIPTTREEFNACGSTCCIAGMTVQLFNNPFEMLTEKTSRTTREIIEHEIYTASQSELPWDSVKDEAASLLEIDTLTARQLFEPWGYKDADTYFRIHPSHNDPKYVARVIRSFMETGEVNWDLDTAEKVA